MPAAALNYYEILEIKRSATNDDISNAFRKLALKWHPERTADKPQADKMFPLVCEAYDVLSHPVRREVFDRYGENGLKNGIPDGSGGVTGGKYAFSTKPEDVFSKFFGSASPFTDLLGPIDGVSPEFYGELTGMTLIKRPAKPKPLVVEMPVTLSDIYNGVMKKLTYSRRVLLPDNTTAEKVEAINLRVVPGWEDGTVAVYPSAGDEGVDSETADVQVSTTACPKHLSVYCSSRCPKPCVQTTSSRVNAHAFLSLLSMLGADGDDPGGFMES
eukprot:scaffold321312_cov35-Tisochrysis_lutea.AAC.1